MAKPRIVLQSLGRVSQRAGVTKAQVYDLVTAGELPEPMRVRYQGRPRLAWPEEQITAWLQRRPAMVTSS